MPGYKWDYTFHKYENKVVNGVPQMEFNGIVWDLVSQHGAYITTTTSGRWTGDVLTELDMVVNQQTLTS